MITESNPVNFQVSKIAFRRYFADFCVSRLRFDARAGYGATAPSQNNNHATQYFLAPASIESRLPGKLQSTVPIYPTSILSA